MFVYRAKGICPSEIHFELTGNILGNVRFLGGGCKGNAQLLGRLLEGRDIESWIPLAQGIQCRNDTSCPDQLARAIDLALSGVLRPADEIRVLTDEVSRRKVAVIAEVAENTAALEAVVREPVDVVYCLGGVSGREKEADQIVEFARRHKVICSEGPGKLTVTANDPENQSYLADAPHIIRFALGTRQAMAFYSGFIQEMGSFSDYTPGSLELLMVANLSDYLRNEAVFPALETMTEQFTSDIVIFGSTRKWSHVKLGKVDFINVGPVEDGAGFKYALLEWEDDTLKVSFQNIG
ncbi:MAG TPA: TSCPD domain-containing protein [Spirochaetia bacterium]|nr:TSCPD domain-containing protein [Spirochaetia bacterium]